ncbi:hypothetical protein AKJ38_04085, partial [candidate division MSBL1 archaeon SCGC-AAA259I14]
DGVAFVDSEGIIREVNQKACDFLECNREDLVGVPLIEQPFYSGEDREDFLERAERVFQGESVPSTTYEVETKEGEKRHIEMNNSIIKKDDDFKGLVLIARDVTERKKSEKKLRESERRYRELFESTNVGIVVHGSEGEIISVNPAAEDVLGLEEKELKEKSLDYWRGKLYRENGEPMNVSDFPVSKVYDSKQPDEETVVGFSLPKGKETKWYITSAVPHFNDKGEIVRVTTFFKDITERKKASERLEMAMSAGEIVFWDWDMVEDKLNFDERWEEMIGYDIDELGEDRSIWKDLIHPEDIKMVEKELERYLKGETRIYETISRMKTKDGKWRYFLDAGKVVEWDENDNPKRFIGILRDVTDQMKAEERKNFLHTLLKQDLGSKSQTIRGYLQLLEEELDLPEKHREYLKKAKKASGEADEILGLAKKLEEVEKTEWVGEKNIVKVLEQVLDDISNFVERKGVEIEKPHPEKIGKVKGDYSLNMFLSQILLSRIQLSQCDTIRIDVRERKEDILLKIEDNGKKLPEDIKNLFIGESYTGETTGVGGVRYYMLREIARHNNANIEVKDSDIGGVRFDVHLKKTE